MDILLDTLCTALLTGGTLATPMPVMIDTHIMVEGQREPFRAFLVTAEEKANIYHIVCPQYVIELISPYQEDLSNVIVKK